MISRNPLMRLRALALSLATLLAAVPIAVQAQDVSSTRSVVRIPGETRIEKIEDLHFGDIIPGDSGGTVTIAPNGTLTTTGTVISAGGDPHAAEFVITRQFLVDFPTYNGPLAGDSIQLTHISQPAESMTLRNFTTDFNRPGFLGLPAYLFRTSYDFRVAGTLDVAADQEPGRYLGFFTVNIDYN